MVFRARRSLARIIAMALWPPSLPSGIVMTPPSPRLDPPRRGEEGGRATLRARHRSLSSPDTLRARRGRLLRKTRLGTPALDALAAPE